VARFLGFVVALSLAFSFSSVAFGTEPLPSDTRLVFLQFHLPEGAESRVFDGSAKLSAGEIVEIRGWGLDPADKLFQKEARWKCTVAEKPIRKLIYAEPDKGIVLKVRAPRDAELSVLLTGGSFSLRLSELPLGECKTFLNGSVTVSPAAPELTLAGSELQEDFPSIATDDDGRVHAVWIASDCKSDCVMYRQFDGERWSEAVSLTEGGECFDPKVIVDGQGRVHAIWLAMKGEKWDIYERVRAGGKWQEPTRITSDPFPDLLPAVVTDAGGRVYLAYQSFRGRNSDIFVRVFENGRWSGELRVTHHPTGDWYPALAADNRGTIYIAWDSFRNGNYDIYMARIERGKISRPIAVTDSPVFEAHPSIACDAEGRVWIAYDVGTLNWGRDYSGWRASFPAPPDSGPLHGARTFRIACYRNGRLYSVPQQVPQDTEPYQTSRVKYESIGVRRFYERPHFTFDGNGNLWCFYRMNRQGYIGHPKGGARWRIYGVCFRGGGWSAPVLVGRSVGRNDQKVSCALGKGGEIYLAYATGNYFVGSEIDYDVCIARVDCAEAKAPPPLGERLKPKSRQAREEPTPPKTVKINGKEYIVCYGDLHRHTEISLCTPTIDGSVVDAYRYAIDVARLDFLAITDHTRDTRPYPWWLTQKLTDLFFLDREFITFYAYERSNPGRTGGHRNVIFKRRGQEVYRFGPEPWVLWKLLRGKEAITIPHTPTYDRKAQRGTWDYNDPNFETLVEIFQAYRKSYELPPGGATPDARKRDFSSVWHALERGYKLGFIASSDHWSTHLSYACVYSEAKTRDAIFEAMRRRHTYAAMDKILLKFTMYGRLMGEEFELAKPPVLDVLIHGTKKIKRVDIVRNNAFIHTFKPEAPVVEFSYLDRKAERGVNYYYVRAEQEDGTMVWSSPIWVNFTGAGK